MKIVCDACQAKYSISDDKVQGKVFKIRCKKCSNIIVVRGGAGGAEPAPAPVPEKDTRVYDYGYEGGDRAPAGDEAVWHVVINQDQVGPMTALEVQGRFTGGEIDSETYIWREGFADWLPLSKVDTFAQLVASGNGAAAAPAPRASSSEAVASMFGGGDEAATVRADSADLFGGAAASAVREDEGDLFGGKPAAAAAASQGAKLRGERNENSVLFSLNNLAQLASDKPAPVTRGSLASSAAAVGAATGPSGGEGSGLIDIRSMASAYMGGPGGPTKPATAGIGSIDDLPVFGGGSFTEPAVIVPIASRAPGNNKLLYALVGSVGLLVVAGVIVVIVLLRGGGGGGTATPAPAITSRPDQVAQTEPKTEAPRPAEPAAADPRTAAPAPTEAKPATTEPPAASHDPPKAAAVEPTPEPKHTTPAQTSAPHRTTASAAAPAAPKPAPKADKADKAAAPAPKEAAAAKPDKGSSDSGGCDEVSCVLNSYEGACCAKFHKGGKAPAAAAGGGAPKGDLPDSLDRAMISDSVAKVKARVMACGDKSPAKGQVKVSVKVAADGSVANVTVRNTPDPALGNCVAAAMQQARFPKTQTGGSFAYPFQF